jgi:hypothetical protein
MSQDRKLPPADAAPERIAIYRQGEAGRAFSERVARIAEEVMFNLEGAIAAADAAVRGGEMSADVLRELRDLHALVRQRALATSPQGRLV